MSMIPTGYTPHSYVDYVVDGVSVTTAQTAFSFSKEFLILAHLEAWHHVNTLNTWTQIAGANVVFTGSSGSGTATLQGGADTRAVGDTIRFRRVTPDTGATRLVDFQPGSLSEADLDTQAKQNLYVAQEVRDEMMLRLGLTDAAEDKWDAGNKTISNIRRPTAATDAAAYQDVLDAIAGSGSLPPVSSALNGNILMVVAGIWAPGKPDDLSSALNFGSAANRDVGTNSLDLPDIAAADARYLQTANNLSEATAATVRTNIGIPASNPAALLSTTDESVAANRVVELDASARYPAADGRNIDLSAHSLIGAAGTIGAIGAFRVGEVTQTFNGTYQTVNVPVAHVFEEQLNTSAHISVNSGSDLFELKTGTYWVWMSLELYSATDGGGLESIVQWRLRRDVGGTPAVAHLHSSVIVAPGDGSNGLNYVTVGTVKKVIVSAADEQFDLQIQMLPTVQGDPRVSYGTVWIIKVEE